MKQVTLAQTTLRVAPLCLGCADFGVKNSEQDAWAMLDYFAQRGANFIDTARIYSDWVPGEIGRSERIVGDYLRARGNRERFVIATKGCHPVLSDMRAARMSRNELRMDCEKSLSALGIERIDLYYLHRDDPRVEAGQIVEWLAELVHDGYIAYPAVSNWHPERIAQAQTYASQHGLPALVANQMLWNLGCYTMRPVGDPTIVTMSKPLYELHRSTKLPAVAYSSQANGFFEYLGSQNAESAAKAQNGLYYTDANRAVSQVVNRVAADRGVSATAIALAYLRGHTDFRVIPAVGCRTKEQLEMSLAALTIELTSEEMQELEQVSQSCLAVF